MDRPDFASGSSQAIDSAHLQGQACTMTIGIVRVAATADPSARCRAHIVDADVSNPLAESYP